MSSVEAVANADLRRRDWTRTLRQKFRTRSTTANSLVSTEAVIPKETDLQVQPQCALSIGTIPQPKSLYLESCRATEEHPSHLDTTGSQLDIVGEHATRNFTGKATLALNNINADNAANQPEFVVDVETISSGLEVAKNSPAENLSGIETNSTLQSKISKKEPPISAIPCAVKAPAPSKEQSGNKGSVGAEVEQSALITLPPIGL
jgi:hypothetical protein